MQLFHAGTHMDGVLSHIDELSFPLAGPANGRDNPAVSVLQIKKWQPLIGGTATTRKHLERAAAVERFAEVLEVSDLARRTARTEKRGIRLHRPI